MLAKINDLTFPSNRSNITLVETFIEEVSALIDKKTLMELYQLATAEAYSFLYVKLHGKKRNDMFMINFSKKLIVQDID